MPQRRKYVCELCFDVFHATKDLNEHVGLNHVDKVISCKKCGKKMHSVDQLRKHLLKGHSTEKPYECKVCKLSFRKSHSLKIHQVIHTGVKAFSCNICRESFARRHNLMRHVKTVHSNLRSYVCFTCNASFKSTNLLSTHIKRVHLKETVVKNHVCAHCKVAFVCAGHLKTHLRNVHESEGYLCDLCGKNIKFWRNLIEHIGVHVGVGHKCDICHKTFSRIDTLTAHKKCH